MFLTTAKETKSGNCHGIRQVSRCRRYTDHGLRVVVVHLLLLRLPAAVQASHLSTLHRQQRPQHLLLGGRRLLHPTHRSETAAHVSNGFPSSDSSTSPVAIVTSVSALQRKF